MRWCAEPENSVELTDANVLWLKAAYNAFTPHLRGYHFYFASAKQSVMNTVHVKAAVGKL